MPVRGAAKQTATNHCVCWVEH